MRIFTKLILPSATLAGLACLPLQTRGSITLNIDAGILRAADGTTPAPDGTLLILAVDTAGDGFQGPTASQFTTGDDHELYRWSLNHTGFSPGYTQPPALSFNLTDFAGLTTGDPLRLYWYPTLSIGASSPGAGTSYGTFRADDTPDGGITWNVPADGFTYNLNFLTTSAGGSRNDALGAANLVTVPEPAFYGVLAGAGCVVGAVIRRARLSKPR